MKNSIFFLVLMINVAAANSYADSLSSDSSKINQGQELYLAYGCAVCHGPLGDGKGIAAVSSVIAPTNFTDSRKYRHGSDRMSIKHSIKFGIKEQNSTMPAFGHITDDELEKISLFLLSLQKNDQ